MTLVIFSHQLVLVSQVFRFFVKNPYLRPISILLYDVIVTKTRDCQNLEEIVPLDLEHYGCQDGFHSSWISSIRAGAREKSSF